MFRTDLGDSTDSTVVIVAAIPNTELLLLSHVDQVVLSQGVPHIVPGSWCEAEKNTLYNFHFGTLTIDGSYPEQYQ